MLIGILSALAYASLMELIFTNRAKETAQTMRTFAERALAEGKRQGKPVEIKVVDKKIQYSIDNDLISSEPLSGGFSESSDFPPLPAGENFNNGKISELRLGLSGISDEGFFVACGARNYCAAAVKTKDKNSFVAQIKKGNSSDWEAL
jgi:type II secretory pathway pseudopilin PulG